MRRLLALAVSAVVVTGGLSGCTTSSSGGCADFVALPTPHDRYRAAARVVVATITPTDRTIEAGAVYGIHRAQVLDTLKGGPIHGAIDVYAPTSCFTTGEHAAYDAGADPLDGADRAVLYLDGLPQQGVHRLITPEAIDPLREGSPLPDFAASTPTPSAG